MAKRILLAMGLCCLGFVSSGWGECLKLSEWLFKADIDLKQWSGKGLVECALPPAVSDLCKPDLSDLRVVGDSSEAVGHAIRLGRGIEKKPGQEFHLKGQLYNRSHVPGKESIVTVDFGERVLKNRLKIVTAGTNFRRKAKIEGSDDGEKWMTIRDEAFLFRVDPGADKVAAYEKNVVNIADNNQRYLRITVYHGEDDKEVVEITNVLAVEERILAVPEGPPLGTTVVPALSVEVAQEKRTTDIILDLGFRNLILYAVKVAVDDRNFFRGVRIEGRDEKSRVVRRPVEDSPAHEKIEKVPWRTLCTGAIYRYSSGEQADNSLDVFLGGASARYLRIRIENGDDTPLSVKGITAYRVISYVQFIPKKPVSHALLFGHPKAVKTAYDIGHYSRSLRKEGVTISQCGEVTPNPAHKPTVKEIPWSERHKEIIWIALLLMGAVLLLLVYRMVRSVPTPK